MAIALQVQQIAPAMLKTAELKHYGAGVALAHPCFAGIPSAIGMTIARPLRDKSLNQPKSVHYPE